MKQANPPPQKNNWTVIDSSNLYGLNRWGDNYFSINQRGNITVSPKGENGSTLDLMELVEELEDRNLKLPLLIRFDDILEDRLKQIHDAFQAAIIKYTYKSQFQGVFPIKCNQQRHVVEEIISIGK